jgi:hypothetical protein
MKKLSFLLLSLIALGACKKDGENTPSASRTDLLTAKKWRVSSLTYTAISVGKITTTDEYALEQACHRDDFYKFNTDKTLVADEGATKCSASDTQTSTQNWDFNSDQTNLLVTSSGYMSTGSKDIVELSATTLRLREVHTYISNGATTTETDDITFTAF